MAQNQELSLKTQVKGFPNLDFWGTRLDFEPNYQYPFNHCAKASYTMHETDGQTVKLC